jgi:phage-related protein
VNPEAQGCVSEFGYANGETYGIGEFYGNPVGSSIYFEMENLYRLAVRRRVEDELPSEVQSSLFDRDEEIVRRNRNITIYRNQLAERGIGAWEILSQKMGKSKQELMDMAAEGKLMADDALPLLIDGLGKYAGAMEKQSKTFGGLMSTMKDAFKEFAGQATIPLFENLKKLLQPAIDTLDQLTEKMRKNPKVMEGFFNTIFKVGGTVFKLLGEAMGNFYNNILKPLFEYFQENKDTIGNIFTGILGVLGTFQKVAGSVLTNLLENVIQPLFEIFLAHKDTFISLFKTFGEIVNAIVPTVGKLLTSLLGNAIIPLLEALSSNGGGISGFFNTLGTIIAKVIPIAVSLLQHLYESVLKPLFDFVAGNKDVLTELFTTFAGAIASLLPAVTSILQSLMENVLQPLINFLVNNRDQVWDFFATFGAIASQVGELLTGTLGTLLIEAILPLIQTIVDNKDVILNLFDNLLSVVEQVLPIVTGLIQSLIPFINELFTYFRENQGTIQNVFTEVGAIMESAIPVITTLIQSVITIAGILWQKFQDAKPILEDAWSNISQTIQGALTFIEGILKVFTALFTGDTQAFGEGLKNIFTGLWEAVKGIFGLALDGLALLITQGIPMIVGAVINLVVGIGEAMAGLMDKMFEAGTNLVKGIWQGMTNAKDWMIGKVKEFAGSILSAFNLEMDINSPSGVFETSGFWMIKGLAQGIEGQGKQAISSMQQLAGDLQKPFENGIAADFDLAQSLGSLNSAATLAQNSNMNREVKVTLEGELAPLVQRVKTDVAGDISTITSGGLT